MNPDPNDLHDEAFTELLAACDDALAGGAAPTPPATLPADLRGRLQHGLAGLQLLREVLAPAGYSLSPLPGVAGPPEGPPRQLGRFLIRRELGRGAFGVVYLAHDPDLRRDVALKVPRGDAVLTPELRQRFLREARAAAALEHDHIVAIYQVGEDQGVPFLAMPLLRGMSLEAWLRRWGPLSVPQVLRLGRQIALGLAVAHQRGLIHRDIKPANLWLEQEQEQGSDEVSAAAGRIKILDFGLARVSQDDPLLTARGTLVGTPAYMAPEQARDGRVDFRCDLFSLGVVLYRLCTGRLPFTGDTRLAMHLCVALHTPAAPHTINPDVPLALSELILELLAKDPARRPGSAQEVAQRLQALAGPPASARRPWRRWLGAAGLAAGFLLVVLVSQTLQSDLSRKANPTTPVGEAAELPAGRVPLDALRRENIPPDELAAAGGGDPRRAPAELVAILGESRLSHWASIHQMAFAPDNRLLASAGRDCTVRLWDTVTCKSVRALAGHEATVHGLSFSPDGKWLASASDDATVRIWEVATGKALHVLRRQRAAGATSVAFRPDGRLLAAGSWDGTVTLWDPLTGTRLLPPLSGHSGGIRALAFRGRSAVLASCCGSGEVRFWDTRTGATLGMLKAHQREANLAFRADGEVLATASWDATVKLWRLAEEGTDEQRPGQRRIQAKPLHTLAAGTDVHGLAFSPDGKTVAVGGLWVVQLWDADTGRQRRTRSVPALPVHCVAFRPDGGLLAALIGHRTIQLWDPQTLDKRGWASPGQLTTVAVSPDGRHLAAGNEHGTATLWEAATAREPRTVGPHPAGINCVAFHPNNATLATGSWDRTIRLWNVATARGHPPLRGHHFSVHGLGFHPDGRWLVSGSGDKDLKVWEISKGYPPPVQTLTGHTSWIATVAVHPGGRLVASGGGDNTVRLWDVTQGREARALSGHRGAVVAVAFRPDGQVLASGSADQTVKLWDVFSGEGLRTPIGHLGPVSSVGFRPDGRVLASAGADGTVRLWDATTGQETVIRLGPQGGIIVQVTFSPDGRHLITANGNGTIYVLRLAPPRARTGRNEARHDAGQHWSPGSIARRGGGSYT
jgi:WD40 repeat protein/serine/threonine protein kinase